MENLKEMLAMDIELFRDEMIRKGLETGFGSSETVQISQILDELILLYQELAH